MGPNANRTTTYTYLNKERNKGRGCYPSLQEVHTECLMWYTLIQVFCHEQSVVDLQFFLYFKGKHVNKKGLFVTEYLVQGLLLVRFSLFLVFGVSFSSVFIFFAYSDNMSLVMRKPAFCMCENKDADQLRSNCAADQRLCFRYTDCTIPLLSESEISSL